MLQIFGLWKLSVQQQIANLEEVGLFRQLINRITAVEQFARQEGYEALRVWPRPLDDSMDRQTLERWYRRRGYEIMADGTGDMEKRVSSALPEPAAQAAAG